MGSDGGATLDTLQIEIEASSTQAADQVTALCNALERLRELINNNYSNIANQIRDIGEAAQSAMPDTTKQRQQAMRNVSQTKIPQNQTSRVRQYDPMMATHAEAIENSFDDDAPANFARQVELVNLQVDLLTSHLSTLYSRMSALDRKTGVDRLSPQFEEARKRLEAFSNAQTNAAQVASKFRDAVEASEAGISDMKPDDIQGLSDAFHQAYVNARKSRYEASQAINEAIRYSRDIGQFGRNETQARGYTEALANMSKIRGMEQPLPEVTSATASVEQYTKAIEEAKQGAQALHDVVVMINQGANIPVDIVRILTDQYHDAAKAARSAGDEAKRAMSIAKSAARDAESAINKEIRSFRSYGSEVSKAEKQYASLQKRIDSISRKKNVSIDAGSMQAAQQSMRNYSDAIEDAKRRAEELKSVIKDFDAGQDIPIERIRELANAYQEAAKAAQKAGDTAKQSVGAIQTTAQDAGHQINFAGTALNALETAVTSTGNVIVDTIMQLAVPAFRMLKDAIIEASTACPALAAVLAALALAIAAIRGTINYVNESFSEMLSIVKKLGSSLLGLAKTGFGELAKSVQMLAKSGIKAAVSGLQDIGKNIVNRITKPFVNAYKATQQWMNAIGRVTFYRVVRSLIKMVEDAVKQGTNNLYQYSRLIGTEFAPAMDKLATSALYLKNSIAAMAAPLVQVLAPAIDFVVDRFVDLLNIIGKVFAALTGKSIYTQAKKHAVEYADAAASASKATKDFKLGIDELNVIDDSGGGAASALEDYGSMFEEVEVPNEIQDWVLKIRAAFEAGDWEGIGNIIADKLNEILDKFDAKAWGEKLGELINKGLGIAYGFITKFNFENLGEKLADAINGLADGIDWELLGKTLGAGLNATYSTFLGFVKQLEWSKIGTDIATAINAWVNEVQWEKIGQAWSTAIVGIFDLISSAVSSVDWTNIGASIATAINNFNFSGVFLSIGNLLKAGIEGLRDFLLSAATSIQWSDIATQISSAINDGFINADIDFEGAGQAVGAFFTALFDFARDTINGIQWVQLGDDIAQFLGGINWEELLTSIGEAFAAGFNAVISTIYGIVSNEETWNKVTEGIGIGVGTFIASLKWDEILIALSDGFVGGINGVIAAVSTVVQDAEFWANLQTGISTGITNFIKNIKWHQAIDSLVLGVKGAIDTAIVALGALTADPSFWTDLGHSIAQGINDIFSDTEKILNFLTGLATLASQILDGISTALEEIGWDGIAETIGKLFGSVEWKDFLSSATRFLVDKFIAQLTLDFITNSIQINAIGGMIVRGLFGGIIDTLVGVETWLQTNLVDPIVNGIKNLLGIHSPSTVAEEIGVNFINGMFAGISNTWKSITDFFSTTFSDLKESITNHWSSIKEDTIKKWEEIKTNLSGKIEQIKNDSVQKFDEIKSKVIGKWEEIKSNSSTKWEEIKTTVSGKIESMKSSITDKFSDIKENISKKWGEIVSSASSWGSDLVRGIANGISGAIGLVTSAASSVASSIRGFLHFSEPDVGPLSDFHTYMPDMLALMASGIRQNMGMVEDAAIDLADMVSQTFSDINYDVSLTEPTLADKFTQTAQYLSDVQVEAPKYDSSQAYDYQGNMQAQNDSVISAIYAGVQSIVSAIQEQDGGGVYIDGKQLMQSVERAQRNRGANIMAGGVLG